LQIGQPVSVVPAEYCGRCRFCLENRLNFCENIEIYGGTLPGAFAEYVSVRREAVLPCEGISLDEAAVVEPVSCGVHAFKEIGSCLGSRVLLFGCGSQGLILLQLSRLHGASRVTAVDLFDKKLDLARRLGADQVLKADECLDKVLRDQGPYDLIIDASGNPKAVQSMFRYVDEGGKLLFFGVCPPDATIEVNPFQVFNSELKIYGSHGLSGDFRDALVLMQSGAIDVSSIITHRLPLEEFTIALEMMQHSVDSVKILIKPELS
jgi:D-arabinitol dehydrogenase (NADP+)